MDVDIKIEDAMESDQVFVREGFFERIVLS